jgi:hypothetical protein
MPSCSGFNHDDNTHLKSAPSAAPKPTAMAPMNALCNGKDVATIVRVIITAQVRHLSGVLTIREALEAVG